MTIAFWGEDRELKSALMWSKADVLYEYTAQVWHGDNMVLIKKKQNKKMDKPVNITHISSKNSSNPTYRLLIHQQSHRCESFRAKLMLFLLSAYILSPPFSLFFF